MRDLDFLAHLVLLKRDLDLLAQLVLLKPLSQQNVGPLTEIAKNTSSLPNAYFHCATPGHPVIVLQPTLATDEEWELHLRCQGCPALSQCLMTDIAASLSADGKRPTDTVASLERLMNHPEFAGDGDEAADDHI